MAKTRRQRMTTMAPTKKGEQPITFKKGSLHSALGVKEGTKIPAATLAAAASGKFGPAVRRKALFAKNVLAKGRKTAAKK